MTNSEIVVSCPIKNDNEYLVEFVEHYLNLGFDRIYFYDNNDDNTIIPQDVIDEYIQQNKVVIINYRNLVFNDVWHRKDFFANYDFEWVLFVDDDEFLELKQHDTIRDFLANFDSDATKIAFNNLHYGDNELCFYEDKRVKDRFTTPLPLDLGTKNYKFNCAVKSLLKKTDMRCIQDLNPHILIDSKPYYSSNNKQIFIINMWRMDEKDIAYDTAFIKHYCTKSLEEFVKCKIKRSQSNNVIHKDRYGFDTYYYAYNKRTKEKDELLNYFMSIHL